MCGGRGFGTCAEGIIKISPISLCSHPDPHQNLNHPVSATPTHTLRVCVNSREVRRSLTWHSSESESALKRFEPVAVAKQSPDGRGTLFALVAARRRKEFKRGKHSSFCPFRSFRTSEKNSERKVALLQSEIKVQSTKDKIKDTPPTQNHAKIKNFSKNLDMFIILW